MVRVCALVRFVCPHDVCVSQVSMYHDPHMEDGGSSKENRMIFTESMPRRVGSFYRGTSPWSCLRRTCTQRGYLKRRQKIMIELN